jgi:tetratricopeptide (TPR) repeat protein
MLNNDLERCRELLHAGSLHEALTAADDALADDAGSFDALELRSRALYLLGREAEAVQTLRAAGVALRAMADAPPPGEPFEMALEPPLLESATPFGSQAMETLLDLRAWRRIDVELLGLLARLAEDNEEYELARDVFEEIIAQDPANLDAWEGLVHVLSHTDLDAATSALDRAMAVFPRHPFFHEFAGFVLFRRRLFAQALSAYERAITIGGGEFDNFESMAECHLALGALDEALALARRAARHFPDDVDAHRFAAEIAVEADLHDIALEHTHQLARLQPSHAETYTYNAWVEIASGDWTAAERTLRLGFHKAMDGAYALLDLVDMLIDDGDADAALRVAEYAETLAPDHAEVMAARGKALREMGMLDQALEAFERAATLAPQDDTYQTWIGVVLDNMSEFDQAIRRFSAVLARRPDDIWTLTNRGITFLAIRRFVQALADFNRGLASDPDDPVLHFWRACARVQLDDKGGALDDLRHAVDFSDEVPTWLPQEGLLDPLRDDPRFQALLGPSEDVLP